MNSPAAWNPLAARLAARAGAGVVIAVVLALLWPGDVPFINDEPQLILNALIANGSGHLAPMGLQGTFGFAYGPFPTWVYQVMLGLTHDLVVVSVLHILVMMLVTAAALWWLARTTGLWPGFVALPLLSPYFWFYARVIWDNTFLLPLGALALAGYAAFLASRSTLGLRVALAAMLCMPLVHLMSASLLVPLGLHMLVLVVAGRSSTARGRGLWTLASTVAVLAALLAWMAWPYWLYLAGPHPPSPPHENVADGWLFPLYGGRLLGARELDYFFGPEPLAGGPFAFTAAISLVAYGMSWFGMAIGVMTVGRAAATRQWTVPAHLAAIALGALAVQSLVHGMTARFEHPHYQSGTWIATVFLAWLAVDWLVRRGRAWQVVGLAASGGLALANLVAVLALAVGLHRSGGTREHYGATLANQQQVARELARYAPTSEIQNRVVMWERYPHALDTLRQLNAAKRIDLPRRVLRLDYASSDPRDGHLRVVDAK